MRNRKIYYDPNRSRDCSQKSDECANHPPKVPCSSDKPQASTCFQSQSICDLLFKRIHFLFAVGDQSFPFIGLSFLDRGNSRGNLLRALAHFINDTAPRHDSCQRLIHVRRRPIFETLNLCYRCSHARVGEQASRIICTDFAGNFADVYRASKSKHYRTEAEPREIATERLKTFDILVAQNRYRRSKLIAALASFQCERNLISRVFDALPQRVEENYNWAVSTRIEASLNVAEHLHPCVSAPLIQGSYRLATAARTFFRVDDVQKFLFKIFFERRLHLRDVHSTALLAGQARRLRLCCPIGKARGTVVPMCGVAA